MVRKLLITSALALAAVLLFGACKATDTAGGSAASQAASNKNAAAPAPGGGTSTVSADGARRVTPAELKQMLDNGTAALYDTRAKGAYDAEHIKGALSMPSNEVGDRTGELPKGKTLVFYCT
ncbi:MAG TPA: rhodanese-like domain-containing protein [Pyrinomonadaceae bacterium]|nr:rhodanese-like domain-containing protein [Pyrinomonadaceae bacterium]